MKDPVIAECDRFYAEEERKMARRDEVERQEDIAMKSLQISYHSSYVHGNEQHYAEIFDSDCNQLYETEYNDSLDDLIVIATRMRDKIAREMAEENVKDAEQNQ